MITYYFWFTSHSLISITRHFSCFRSLLHKSPSILSYVISCTCGLMLRFTLLFTFFLFPMTSLRVFHTLVHSCSHVPMFLCQMVVMTYISCNCALVHFCLLVHSLTLGTCVLVHFGYLCTCSSISNIKHLHSFGNRTSHALMHIFLNLINRPIYHTCL